MPSHLWGDQPEGWRMVKEDNIKIIRRIVILAQKGIVVLEIYFFQVSSNWINSSYSACCNEGLFMLMEM